MNERSRIGWTAAGTLAVSALGIVTPIAGLLLVDESARTVWVLMATMISIGVSVDFGIPDYVATFSEDVDLSARRSLLRRCGVVTACGSAVVAALGIVVWLVLPTVRAGESFGAFDGAMLFAAAGIAAAGRSIVQVHASALQARRRIARRNVLLVGQAALQLVLTLAFLTLSRSPFSLPIGTALSSIIVFAAVRPNTTPAPERSSAASNVPIPALTRYARNRFSVGLLGLVLTQGDRWIVAAVTSGVNVVPLLDVAQRLSQPAKMVAIAAATAAADQYGSLRSNTRALKAFLRRMQAVTVSASIGVALCGSLGFLCFLWWSDVERFPGAEWLALLPLMGVVHAATANPVSALVARGRTDIEVRAALISFTMAVAGVVLVALVRPALIPWVTPGALVVGSTYLLLVVSRTLESESSEPRRVVRSRGSRRGVTAVPGVGTAVPDGARAALRGARATRLQRRTTGWAHIDASARLRSPAPPAHRLTPLPGVPWDPLRVLSAVWLALCLALPLEAATRTGLVGRGATIVAAGGVLVLLRRRAAGEVLLTMATFLLVLITHGVDRDVGFVLVTCFAAFGAGHLLGPAKLIRVVVGVAALDLMVSVIEYRRGRDWWVSALGSSLRRVVGEDLRSSGLTGHPLVSSVLVVASALGLWSLSTARWHRPAAVLLLMTGAVWHGSRSALAIPVLVAAVLWVFGSSITRRSVRVAGSLGVALLVLVATGAVTLPGRLADLSTFGDADSRTARVEGLSSWSAPFEGTVPEVLFGRGMGASAARVSELGLSSLGLPTVENSFITSAYDFGVLGALLTFGTLIIAVRAARLRTEKHEIAVAVTVIAVALYGLFFDTLYWALPRVLGAACVGALFATSPSRIRRAPRDHRVNRPLHAT